MRAMIDDAASVCTLINTFGVSPARQDAVVTSLKDFTERHARNFPGFISASVHVSLDGRRVVNYVQWQSEADLVAMLATPVANAHMTQIGILVESVYPIFYRVAYVGSQDNELA